MLNLSGFLNLLNAELVEDSTLQSFNMSTLPEELAGLQNSAPPQTLPASTALPILSYTAKPSGGPAPLLGARPTGSDAVGLYNSIVIEYPRLKGV